MNNDLISREAVLNEIMKAQDKLKSDDDFIWERNKNYFKGLAWANRIIIDAPTVYPICENKACKYRANARPQGEWIFLGDNPNRDNPNPNHKWSCNKCGRGVKEQEKFCPNCGADMRKGGAE